METGVKLKRRPAHRRQAWRPLGEGLAGDPTCAGILRRSEAEAAFLNAEVAEEDAEVAEGPQRISAWFSTNSAFKGEGAARGASMEPRIDSPPIPVDA